MPEKISPELLETRPLPPIPVEAKKESEVADYIMDLWLEADRYRRNIDAIRKTENVHK